MAGNDLAGVIWMILVQLRTLRLYYFFPLLIIAFCNKVQSQADSMAQPRQFKNVIRYNLSSALIFGIDRYIVFGYERVISPHQSLSINVGTASLPKVININTDSF